MKSTDAAANRVVVAAASELARRRVEVEPATLYRDGGARRPRQAALPLGAVAVPWLAGRAGGGS